MSGSVHSPARNGKSTKKFSPDRQVRHVTGSNIASKLDLIPLGTGRQLFETGKTSAQADLEYEDDDAGGEFSYDRYSREERDKARLEREKQEESGGTPAIMYDSD